jgi:hypothetical protein
VFWLPSIVKHLTGQGIGSTGLLSAVPYAAAVIAMIAVSAASDRLACRRVFTSSDGQGTRPTGIKYRTV